jgi:hypothetical protein
MWDLWWTKWHWDRFFSEFFGLPLSVYHSAVAVQTHIIWGMRNMLAKKSRHPRLGLTHPTFRKKKKIVGVMSSWISGNFFTCDWITTCRTERLTGLFQTKTLLHGQYPELKFILCTGQLKGAKFCTCYSGHCLGPKCPFGVGNKTPSPKTYPPPPSFPNRS